MGWETGITLGASAIKGVADIDNAKSESSAIAASAENTATNQANQTSRNIGSLETSFLKGGIALTGGGGPAAFFQQAAAQGTTDISRTISNANASISNTMNAARTTSLNGLGQSFSKIGVGTIGSAVNTAYQGSWLQTAWNGIAGNPDPSPASTGFGQSLNFSGTGSVGSGVNWGTPNTW